MSEKSVKKLVVIDKGQGQRTYQAVLDHATGVDAPETDVKILMPWSLLSLETGILFPEAISLPAGGDQPARPTSYGTQESKRLRTFLAEHTSFLEHYTGDQDKAFAHALNNELTELVNAIPAESRASPDMAIRSLIEAAFRKKEKPKSEIRKAHPRLAPVTDTSRISITDSLARAAEEDPLSLIASDIREAAELLPDEGAASPKQLLLRRAADLDKMVADKLARPIRKTEAATKITERPPALAEPHVEKPNPLAEKALKDFYTSLKEIDAAFKAAGISDDLVRKRFGDTTALEAIVPEGVGMAAFVQTLFLSPAIRDQFHDEFQQWMKGRVHASIMDYAIHYDDYLHFNQGQFDGGIHFFVVTNNKGFNNGVEEKLREHGNLLRDKDRFHIFESGDSLDRYFKKKEAKKAVVTAPAEPEEHDHISEGKKQRRPATADDLRHIEALLASASARASEIRGHENWPRLTRDLHELLVSVRKRIPATGTSSSSSWVKKVEEDTPAPKAAGQEPGA